MCKLVVSVTSATLPLPVFISTLKQLGYRGPYSLHSEYKGRHSFRDLTTQECLDQTAVDLAYLRTLV